MPAPKFLTVLLVAFMVICSCVEGKVNSKDKDIASLIQRLPSAKVVYQTIKTYLDGNGVGGGIGMARPVAVASSLPSQYMVQNFYLGGNSTNPCAGPVDQAQSIGINTCMLYLDVPTNTMEYVYVSYASSTMTISTYSSSQCTGPTNSVMTLPVGSCYGNVIKVTAPQSTINYGSAPGLTVA